MKNKKKLIISHIFQFASAQYFSQFVGFFTAVFTRRFLGPVSMGIWSILKVIMGYAAYTSLGTTSTIPYKLPILKGQGKEEEANKLISAVFNFVTITTFICSIGLIIYALIFAKILSKEIFIGLLAMSVILLSQRIYAYYMMLLRAHKDFGVISKSIAFDAVVNLGLVLFIVSKFRLYGFYAIVIIMPVLNVLFIRRYVTYNLRFSLNLKGIASYIRYGIPIFLNGILYQVLHSTDKIMIGAMLGLEQLWFYSIALMTETYSTGMAKNFSIVIQPHFMEGFGRNGMERSSEHVVLYSQVTAYFMTVILSLIFLCAPVFITYVLPAFTPGITALRILLLAMFFFTISPYLDNFLIALGKQAILIPMTILSLFINIILNFIFIKKGFGISGVASATAISALVYFCAVSIYVFAHRKEKIIITRFFVKTLFPLVYCIFSLNIIETMIRFQDRFAETIMRTLVFGLVALPLVLYINRKTGIVKILSEILLEKVGIRAPE